MNARINIITPSGQSLEGFPIDGDVKAQFNIDYFHNEVWSNRAKRWVKLHKGDVVTIEIL